MPSWMQITLIVIELLKLIQSKPKDEGLSKEDLDGLLSTVERKGLVKASDMGRVRESFPMIKGLLEDVGGLLK